MRRKRQQSSSSSAVTHNFNVWMSLSCIVPMSLKCASCNSPLLSSPMSCGFKCTVCFPFSACSAELKKQQKKTLLRLRQIERMSVVAWIFSHSFGCKKKKRVICEAHSDDSQQAVDLEFDTLLYALKPLKENIKRLEAGLCKSRNGQGIASSSCKRRKVRFAELTQCLQIFHLKVPVTMHHFMIPSWPKNINMILLNHFHYISDQIFILFNVVLFS